MKKGEIVVKLVLLSFVLCLMLFLRWSEICHTLLEAPRHLLAGIRQYALRAER
jgi:hypothetical protein